MTTSTLALEPGLLIDPSELQRLEQLSRSRLEVAHDVVADVRPERSIAIRLDHLSKHYGDRQVLHDISLDIAPGEFVAVVGRSGCGKSTLLRLLAGLEAVTPAVHSGVPAIRFDQRPQSGPNADTRIMFQDARLLPWKRVLQNVALGMPQSALSKAQVLLEQVGLQERGVDWPGVLSGGQKQRVALARALVHAPRLLLLDEPLGALDALTRIEMQQLIESLWQRDGFTAVLVTHDVAEAIALADRVVLIEQGRVTLDVRVDLPRPRSRGSAAFAALEDHILRRVLQHPEEERIQPQARIYDLSKLRLAV